MRFYISLAFFLILVLLAQPMYARRRNTQRELERAVREGKELYEEKYYMGAIEKWTDVLKVDPWNEEVKLLIERALKRYEELTGRLETAYQLLEDGSLDEAHTEFIYVQENSSTQNLELAVLVDRGLEAVEDARRDLHYRKIIEEGDLYLNREEFKSARASYEEAREFYPDGEIAPQRIALAEKKMLEAELGEKLRGLREDGRRLFANDRLKSSRAKWEEVLEIVSDDEEAALYISKIDFKLQEREHLLEMAKGYYTNGIRLFEEKRYEDAIDQFQNSIAMNYQVKRSRRYIEECRNEIRKREERDREVNAQLVAKYLREGIKFYNLTRYRDSLSQLNRGLELDAENTQIREYIVRDIIALKREEEKVVLPSSPFYKLIENLKLLGTQAYDAGNYGESIKYWEEILLIFPFNEEARVSLTRTLGRTDPTLQEEILTGMYRDAGKLMDRRKKREAVQKLKLILEVDPDFRDTAALLAKLEAEEEREERHQKKVVTEKDRRNAERLYRRGLDHYRSERLEDAIGTLKEALLLNPEYVDAQVLLARTESKLRNLQRAVAAAQSEDEGASDELSIRIKKHYIEGVTFYMNGLYAEAISEWEEMLRLDPSNESVKTNIERARKRLEMMGTQG